MFFYSDSALPPRLSVAVINTACCLLGSCCCVPASERCCSPVLADNLQYTCEIISVSLSSSLSPCIGSLPPVPCSSSTGMGRAPVLCTLVTPLNLMGKAHHWPLLRSNLANVIMWRRHKRANERTKSPDDDRISGCFSGLRGGRKSCWSHIWLQLAAVTEVGALLSQQLRQDFLSWNTRYPLIPD